MPFVSAPINGDTLAISLLREAVPGKSPQKPLPNGASAVWHIHVTARSSASLPRYTFAVIPPGQPFDIFL